MSIALVVNGITYDYPEVDDTDWGAEATDWAAAITNGTLQKAGGLFQLLAEVDFGTTFGIKSLYYKSRTTNTADAGPVRLARADVINWRNEANDANLSLSVDSSNNLLFNGTPIVSSFTVADTTTIDLDLSASILTANIKSASITNAEIATLAAIAYSKLSLLDSIVNSDVKSNAAIAYSKLNLLGTIVNTDVSASAAIAYSKLALGNSIVNADVASGAAIAYSKLALTGSVVNADVAAAAAIAVNKLAALTVSRAVVTDASGFVSAATTTAVEIGYVNGVTSAIQTQLNAKTSNPMTTGGDVIYGGASGLPTRLANGLAGQVLASTGGTTAPQWSSYLPATVQKFILAGSFTYNKNYTFLTTTGSATVGATYTNNGVTFTVSATVASGTQFVMSGSGAPTASGTLTKSAGTGDATITFTQFRAPLYLRVRGVAAGGGGAGSSTTGAANGGPGGGGGSVSFGTSLLSATGGIGGALAGNGGTGGGYTVNAPAVDAGSVLGGGGGGSTTTGSFVATGGNGGNSFFGGGGGSGNAGGGTAGAGALNSGGGGAGADASASSYTGSGGGAGGYFDAFIYSPSATYSYSIGAFGSSGTAGTSGRAGGAGALGMIIVEEYYQ